jgi:TetR/AcrR family transcriptional regulator, repressor for neighboring sulfatase
VSKSDRDRGTKREATALAILDAAEKLFAERGYAAVSVRDIGQEAGVSHALVHRYLGTKRDVYRAVLKRHEDSIRSAAGETEDLAAAMSLMMREGLLRHRQYLRLIAQSALGGLPFETTMGRFPAVERLVELAEAREAASASAAVNAVPARLVVAAAVSLYLGWTAMEPWLLAATGSEDLDEETVVAGLERILLDILVEHLQGGDS